MILDISSLRGLDAFVAAGDQLTARLAELDKEADGRPFTEEQRAEFEEIGGEEGLLAQVQATIAEFKIRDSKVRTAVATGGRQVEGPESHVFSPFNIRKTPDNIFDLAAYRRQVNSIDELPRAYAEGAKRAIDLMHLPLCEDADKGREALNKLLARHAEDANGWVGRHIIGTSDPAYVAAWTDHILGRSLTGQRLAVMQTYSSQDGGVSIPVEIDPTFINISDGSANPIRAISRNVTTTAKTWSAITTEGVTAAYVSEATRSTTGASDGAPDDLDNPTVTPVRCDVAPDLTLEYLQDYGSAALMTELGTLVRNAKDDVEAEKFINGDGTDEPDGIVARIVTDKTSLVETTTNDAFLLADIDKLIGSLPPRFRNRARAKFVANNAILQRIPAFGTAGQPSDSIYSAQSNMLRGYPVFEASAMDDTVTAGNEKILLFGDFNQFVVVDRLGLTTKVLDTRDANGRPTGGSTLYCAWRNGTKCLAVNAFRLLYVQ